MKIFFWSLVLLVTIQCRSVEVGAPAPDFTAHDQDGAIVKLGDFAGKYLLIYFYPKDETPGCTKEACSLRDQYSDFKKNNIAILGVSVQDADSHKKFREKYHLPFPLLVDSNAELAKQFGVDKFPVVGLLKRQSVLIGKDGHVVKFYPDVNPDTQTKDVLADVQKVEKHESKL